MQQNEFLRDHFMSPQLCKDYRLPTTEFKIDPPPDLGTPPPAASGILHEETASADKKKFKVVKKNRQELLGNYPNNELQRKRLLTEADHGLQLKKPGKIKSNKLVPISKQTSKDSMAKKSNTEPSEMLGQYIDYLKHRDRVRFYSKSGVRKISSQSAVARPKSNAREFQSIKGIHNESLNDKKVDSTVRFFNPRTQILQRRQSFLEVYTEGKKENKILGTLEARIPSIPLKEDLPTFLANYRPNNEDINMKTLLKTNFCAVEFSATELYIGEMIGKHKQGIGILITANLCFEGLWKNNQKLKGVQITRSGVYRGTFVNNKREGHGQFHRHSGDIYVGQWKQGRKHGNGLWINSLGQSYNGSWQNGKPEGNGLLTLKGRIYKGNFSNFRQSGYGKQRYANGDSFEGFYRSDLPHGKGTYCWTDGISFEGEFANGLRQGYGEVKNNKHTIYRGFFVNDKPQGECQIFLKNKEVWRGFAKKGERQRPYTRVYAEQMQRKWPSNKSYVQF